MSETPRPIRAWAEYNEWLVLLDGIGDALGRDADYFTSWEMPNGAEGNPQLFPGMLPFQHWIAFMGHGPLRSLRVLLSTGHEVTLDRIQSRDPDGEWFEWRLWDSECTLLVSDRPESGLSDTAAVERAIAAAVACVEGQE